MRHDNLNRVISVACLVLAVLLPTVALITLIRSPQVLVAAAGLSETLGPIALWQHALVVFLALIPVTCLSYGLIRARQCFRSFARGEFFFSVVTRDLRGFAAGMFLSVVMGLIVTPLASIVLTFGAEAGKRSVAFHFGSNELLNLLFAGMVWQIAVVLSKAAALAEENSQFV